MWTYVQATGEMIDKSGAVVERKYAGIGEHKNRPESQCVKDKGPLPRGYYTIGPAYDDPHRGPTVLPLTPDLANDMCGRDGFLIHGDSIDHPGDASNGCIIMGPATRKKIDVSNDKRLRVVAASMFSPVLAQLAAAKASQNV